MNSQRSEKRTKRQLLAPTPALRHCEEITRREAKNFWYGIRLLPPDKRRALAAVYAMARRIDDIGDGDLEPAGKRAALDEVSVALGSLDPGSRDPVIAALAQTHHISPLPLDAFECLVEGVRMDLAGTRYPAFTDLVPYCRCVAGSIGRLSLAVFRLGDRPAEAETVQLADDLGVALQLTNIIRDVREDLGMGRVYLPLEDLERFGVPVENLSAPPGDRGAALIRYEAERAQEWFERGLRLLPRLDRRSAACVGAMAGIYHRLLQHIERRPDEVFRRRLSLPPIEKAATAVRALAGRPV